LVIWVAFAHIGLPCLFACALMIFSAASSRELTWDITADVAFEMTILSCGATAAIFENSTVAASYGPHATTVAIGVVAVNLVLAGVIVLLRRFAFPPINHQFAWAAGVLTLGAMALFVTSFSLWYGTYHTFF
jgi:hypothetical protein